MGDAVKLISEVEDQELNLSQSVETYGIVIFKIFDWNSTLNRRCFEVQFDLKR